MVYQKITGSSEIDQTLVQFVGIIQTIKYFESRPEPSVEEKYQAFVGMYDSGALGIAAREELANLQWEAANGPFPELPEHFADDLIMKIVGKYSPPDEKIKELEELPEKKSEKRTAYTLDDLICRNKLYLLETAAYLLIKVKESAGYSEEGHITITPEKLLKLILNFYSPDCEFAEEERKGILEFVGDQIIIFNAGDRGLAYVIETDMLWSFYQFLRAEDGGNLN